MSLLLLLRPNYPISSGGLSSSVSNLAGASVEKFTGTNAVAVGGPSYDPSDLQRFSVEKFVGAVGLSNGGQLLSGTLTLKFVSSGGTNPRVSAPAAVSVERFITNMAGTPFEVTASTMGGVAKEKFVTSGGDIAPAPSEIDAGKEVFSGTVDFRQGVIAFNTPAVGAEHFVASGGIGQSVSAPAGTLHNAANVVHGGISPAVSAPAAVAKERFIGTVAESAGSTFIGAGKLVMSGTAALLPSASVDGGATSIEKFILAGNESPSVSMIAGTLFRPTNATCSGGITDGGPRIQAGNQSIFFRCSSQDNN